MFVAFGITVIIAIIAGIITYRYYSYFYLSKKECYRKTKYQIFMNKLAKTFEVIISILFIGTLLISALYKNE